jgi:dihydropyrimidinase
MVDTAITNGRVVTERAVTDADVGITDGRITAITAPGTLHTTATDVIDASGRLVLPGFIDSHVHVNLELGEYTTTDEMSDLTRAAAYGGVTTVIPFAVPDRDESPLAALGRRREEAAGDAYVDYSFHGCLTEATETSLEQVPELIDRGATSIKAFMVYEDRLMLDNGELRDVMDRTADAGGTMLVHAEDNAIIGRLIERHREQGDMAYDAHGDTHPPVSETTAMWTVSELVAESECPTLLVHASARRTEEIAAHAERNDLPLAVETCPHYLALTDEVYGRDGGEAFVCSPPIRSNEHREALKELVSSSQVAVVNSDHCGYTMSQKRRHRDDITRMPNGLPGVETTGPVLYTEGVTEGSISIKQFVRLMSTNVAKLFGLYPEKGTIAVGSDADIVIFDPDEEWTIEPESLHMATDYSPFQGRAVTGRAETVLVRGSRVIDGELVDSPPVGEYRTRTPGSAGRRYREL